MSAVVVERDLLAEEATTAATAKPQYIQSRQREQTELMSGEMKTNARIDAAELKLCRSWRRRPDGRLLGQRRDD